MRISNLKTEEGREINGKTGEVGDFDAGKGRWILAKSRKGDLLQVSSKLRILKFPVVLIDCC